MARSIKCLGPLLATGLGSLVMGPALAQDPYGLTNLKPYHGSVAPPANGLAAVIRSQKPETNGAAGKAKPYDQPLFTIHASGALMIDSVMRH